MSSESPAIDPPVPEGWYIPTLETIPQVALEVFKKHTDLPEDKILPHILAVREKAWKVFPYPCIGVFRFLDFSISQNASYDSVITRLKSGETFLDLGCCLGQDIRKLISDGAPSENTFGADLEPGFVELGYDLFLDRETLKTTFLTPVNIFDDSETAPLNTLKEKIDIVHIGSFLHLFKFEDQVRAAKKIAGLLKPKKGSMVLGRQAGSYEPGEYEHRSNTKRTMYRHDLETFEKFWKVDVGGEWDVDVVFGKAVPRVDPQTGISREPVFNDKAAAWLRFSVTRK